MPELTQSGVQSDWKNESLEYDPRFCFYSTKIIQNIRPIGSFPFFPGVASITLQVGGEWLVRRLTPAIPPGGE